MRTSWSATPSKWLPSLRCASVNGAFAAMLPVMPFEFSASVWTPTPSTKIFTPSGLPDPS